MPTSTTSRRKRFRGLSVIEHYDIAADAKSRISLRRAKTKYFHVKALSNGAYLLEPRVLVPPQAIPARTLKAMKQSAEKLRKGHASGAVTLPSAKRAKRLSCFDLASDFIGSVSGLPKDVATNAKYLENLGE